MRNRGTIIRTLLALALSAGTIAGCTPPEEITDEELELTPDESKLPWDQLMGSLEAASRSSAGQISAAVAGAPSAGVLLTAMPVERLALLPLEIQRQPGLARLAIARKLEKVTAYENGVFGLVGTAKLFAATTDKIQGYERLYWVIVKVLSEKYGCFMIRKETLKNVMRATCRDKRRVVFWKDRGKGWVQFHARQYDSEGYEIVVRQKQIVRVGTKRLF